MTARRYRLLGGLEVVEEPGRIDLGTRKQRALLAVLLLAEGQTVSIDRLVDRLWGDEAPDRAEVSVHSYVSTLRRVLEPNRAPRSPSTVLVTRGTGYALDAPREHVDAWRFADLVAEGRRFAEAGEQRDAATTLRNALAMYAPLLPDFEGEAFREPAARHLDNVHAAGLELSYEVRLALGEHRMLVADLESAVSRHPLHEGLWALLALARYRVGQQSDALRAIADARRVLAEETGVDPGPRLRQLETDLLAQAPHLDAPAGPVTVTERPKADTPTLVGRVEELAGLITAVTAAAPDAVAIVEGEPGVGKSRLLEEVSTAATADGVQVLWGRCVEGAGAPSMWPWIQVFTQLQGLLTDDERTELFDSELARLVTAGPVARDTPSALPDGGARFRLFDRAARLFESVATRSRILVVLDDIQWADAGSLALFEHLATRHPRSAVLVGAMRTRSAELNDALRQTLADVSRIPGHRRVRLGPLGADDVAELVRRETGRAPSAQVLASIRARTEGNPFFVRELSRLLLEVGGLDGDRLGAGVPSGVRDVVRGRMAGLPDSSKDLLQLAALIGREVDLGLLARAADLDVETCLDRLEPAESLGLLGQTPDNPFAFRFAHDLVRESIVEATAPLRSTRLHLRVADALEALGQDRDEIAEQLAHHLWSAGPLADRRRTATALLDAARLAIAKYSYDVAERQLNSAATAARALGDAELELTAVALLTTTVSVQVGYVGATLTLLERAEDLARRTGQDRVAADFLYARWAAHSQGVNLDVSHRLAQDLYRRGQASDDPAVRMYGDYARGIDEWDHGNIAASLELLTRSYEFIEHPPATVSPSDVVLRFDLELLLPNFLAHMTGLSGNLTDARRRLDRIEADLRGGPYPLTVWGAFSLVTAAMAGEPDWALPIAERCVTADPDLGFEFLGAFIRVVRGWARSLLGEPDQGIAEIRSILSGMVMPRSGWATWHSLLAEALLMAGRLDEAGTSLDTAEEAIERIGQRYMEPLTVLLRARWLAAVGADRDAVLAKIAAARAMAVERGALLYVQRADAVLAGLG